MRYLGGKSQIAKHICELIEKEAQTNQTRKLDYYEPFCGACSVAVKLKQELFNHLYLSDIHMPLITMWQNLQKGWIPPEEVSELLYNQYKINKDENDPLTAFIGFGCSFGGKYFNGYARSKDQRNYAKLTKNTLLNKVSKLNSLNTTFYSSSYEDISPINSIVYCDPPYQNTTKYRGVEHIDYNNFWETIRSWSDKNIVFVSSYEAPKDFEEVLVIEKSQYLGFNRKPKQIEKVFRYRV